MKLVPLFAFLLVLPVAAQLDSGGGQTAVGSGTNYSSIGSPFATGQRVISSGKNLTGRIEVLHQPASLTPDPTSASADPLGETLTFEVPAPTGTSWTAESTADWLTITGNASGTGNGTVTYTVDRNSDAELREGQIRITTEGEEPSNIKIGRAHV